MGRSLGKAQDLRLTGVEDMSSQSLKRDKQPADFSSVLLSCPVPESVKRPQSISGWIFCIYLTGSTQELIHPQCFRCPLVQQDDTKIKHSQIAASYDPLFCGSLTSNSRYEWVFDPTQTVCIPHCKGARRERLIVSGR